MVSISHVKQKKHDLAAAEEKLLKTVLYYARSSIGICRLIDVEVIAFQIREGSVDVQKKPC
jgi:hypothetical protein